MIIIIIIAAKKVKRSYKYMAKMSLVKPQKASLLNEWKVLWD